MRLDFSASVLRNVNRVKKEINDKCVAISIELFLSIVKLSPSPSNPGETAKGLLANQWYPHVGKGFSSAVSTNVSRNGGDSITRINALKGTQVFLGKDGTLTLANNLHYAYRAEMLGWPRMKDPKSNWQWSGKVGPYRMVALSLQKVAAKHR